MEVTHKVKQRLLLFRRALLLICLVGNLTTIAFAEDTSRVNAHKCDKERVFGNRIKMDTSKYPVFETIYKFIPWDAHCGEMLTQSEYLERTFNGVVHYFILYGFENSDGDRTIHMRVVSKGKQNSFAVLDELTTINEIDPFEIDYVSVGLEAIEFPRRREFVFGTHEIDCQSLTLAWNGKSLRPVGPDPRLKQGKDEKRSSVARGPLCDPYFSDQQATEGNEGWWSTYRIQPNLYLPWVQQRLIYLHDSVQIGEEIDGPKYHSSALIGPTTQEAIFDAPTPDDGMSILLEIEYPEIPYNMPESVKFFLGEALLYEVPANADKQKPIFTRLTEEQLKPSGMLRVVLEGKKMSSIAFTFEHPVCDLNEDGYIDYRDFTKINEYLGQRAKVTDPRDINGNGVLDKDDEIACHEKCNMNDCSFVPLSVPDTTKQSSARKARRVTRRTTLSAPAS